MTAALLPPLLWFAFAAGVPADSLPGPVASLRDAETAFVAAAAKEGIRAAMASRMSPLAILFQPHPTSASQWIKDHELPAAQWTPAFAEVAGGGDLGYTAGPWRTSGADSTAGLAGAYLSCWRYHPQTGWKLMLHITAGAATPAQPAVSGVVAPAAAALQFVTGPVPIIASHDTIAARRQGLGTVDAALGASVAERGWREAYARIAAEDVRRYEPGEPPAMGRAAVLDRVAKDDGAVEWSMVGSWIAQSVDLGYTYGKCLRGGDGQATDRTEWAYVHVWRLDRRGGRHLALEFLSPIVRR